MHNKKQKYGKESQFHERVITIEIPNVIDVLRYICSKEKYKKSSGETVNEN